MATVPLPGESAELIERSVPFQGHFRVARYVFRQELYHGGMSAPFSREVFERGQAAALLPYDPVRDEVVLIRQFRAGSFAAGRHPWSWEIVAGIIEEGESPEDLVRRETVEEANLEVRDLAFINSVMLTPGACSESCTMFAGRIDASGGKREHSRQGDAVRGSSCHARPRRDRQRDRGDRPAVARLASRRVAQTLELGRLRVYRPPREAKRRVGRASTS
jgi:ADP-ribose pyrophosphatase